MLLAECLSDVVSRMSEWSC